MLEHALVAHGEQAVVGAIILQRTEALEAGANGNMEPLAGEIAQLGADLRQTFVCSSDK
jgi:hypothetical protein